MRVTLDSFNYIEDPDYFTPAQTLDWYKRGRNIQTIVIHWWNTPEKAGTFDQTINYLKQANDTSIHFIVSDTRITQMVNLNNTAFHAMGANPISVGIEVDPKVPGRTYETTGALVRFIREILNSDLPLSKHSDHVSTSCPGTLNVGLIESWARDENFGNNPAPAPVEPVPPNTTVINWRVKDLSGNQLGAYSLEAGAWSKYIEVKRQAKIYDKVGTDVTNSFLLKFDPPAAPVVPTNPRDDVQDRDIAELKQFTIKLKEYFPFLR